MPESRCEKVEEGVCCQWTECCLEVGRKEVAQNTRAEEKEKCREAALVDETKPD